MGWSSQLVLARLVVIEGDQDGLFLYSGTPGPITGSLTGVQQTDDGPYVLQANEFNSGAPFRVDYTTGSPYGFRVGLTQINNAPAGAPGAFPSVIFGNHFGRISQGSPLPLLVSGITAGQVVTSCAATLVQGGTWDFVYDNWYNPSPTSTNNATGLEHMIWLANSNSAPPGSLFASNVLIGGQRYNVFFHGPWANAAQGTVSFQFTTQQASVTIDLQPMIAYMVAQGWLPLTDYLIAVEAGFEVWQGGAGLAINSFTVSNAPAIGSGNSPLIAVTAQANDPFGAPVSPSGAVPAVTVGQDGSEQVQAAIIGGRAVFALITPGFVDALLFGGQSGNFAFAELVGPASEVAGHADLVVIDLNSSDGVSSSANAEHVYTDAAGGAHAYAVEDCGGFRIAAGSIVGVDPTTGSSSANPANSETWHLIGATGGNVSIPANGFGKYRRNPQNELQISCSYALAGPTNPLVINATPLPAVYRPQTAVTAASVTTTSSGGHWGAAGTETLAIRSGSNDSGCQWTVTSDGFLIVRGHSTFATTLTIDSSIPLDV